MNLVLVGWVNMVIMFEKLPDAPLVTAKRSALTGACRIFHANGLFHSVMEWTWDTLLAIGIRKISRKLTLLFSYGVDMRHCTRCWYETCGALPLQAHIHWSEMLQVVSWIVCIRDLVRIEDKFLIFAERDSAEQLPASRAAVEAPRLAFRTWNWSNLGHLIHNINL